MAFLLNQDEEEIKKQNQLNISGSSNVFNNQLPGANTGAKTEKKSGSWTNLNQYLDSNKEQAGEMATKVTSDIDNSAMDAQTKINTAKSSAPGAVQSYDADTIKNTYYANPDASKAAEYQSLKTTGGYSGPADVYSVNGWNDAETQTTKASEKLKQSQTEGGRQELLKNAYSRPTYSQGQSTLDNLLVQNDAGSKTKFQDVQSKWSGLTDMLGSTKNELNTKINQNVQAAQSNKALLPNVETSYVNEFLSPIQQRAEAANKNNPALIKNIIDDAKDETLAADTLAKLGLTTGQNIYDLDLSSYVTPDYTQANANNVATTAERTKYQNLMKLIGADSTALSENGSSINPISFNSEKFNTDRAAKDTEFKNAYENERGTILNSSYLLNPNASGGYDGYIPGSLTSRRDLSNASAKELESYWLPIFQQAHTNAVNAGQANGPGGTSLYSSTEKAIRKSLADWNQKYYSSRVIKKG